jgi:hypothetical protein
MLKYFESEQRKDENECNDYNFFKLMNVIFLYDDFFFLKESLRFSIGTFTFSIIYFMNFIHFYILTQNILHNFKLHIFSLFF